MSSATDSTTRAEPVRPGDANTSPTGPEAGPSSDRGGQNEEGVPPVQILLGLVVVFGIIAMAIHYENIKAGFAMIVAFCFATWAFRLRSENQGLRGFKETDRVNLDLARDAERATAETARLTSEQFDRQLREAQEAERHARERLEALTPGADARAKEAVACELRELGDANAGLARELDIARGERDTALQSRDAFALLVQLHTRVSLLGEERDQGSWWRGFVDETGKSLAWSSATHVAVIAVKGRGCRGLPIRIPNAEQPAPFIAKSESLKLELKVVRSPLTGKLSITLTDARWAPDMPAMVETSSAAGTVLLVDHDAAALLIRERSVHAYRDIVLVTDMIARKAGEFGQYFRALQPVPGFVRQATLSMPAHPGAGNAEYAQAVAAHVAKNPPPADKKKE